MHKSADHTSTDVLPSARTRGRPRAFDRDAALGRAMRLFWAKGYEATSIADLTARMGIGTKSLYAAFGSKEQLCTEALQLYLASYEGAAWGNFRKAETAREAAAAYLRDTAIGMTDCAENRPPGCMVALGFVGGEDHKELDGRMRSTRAGVFDLLSNRFQRAFEEGELLRASDVPKLARFIQTVHSGMAIRARDGANRDELLDVVDVAMAGWDGIAEQSG